MKKIFGILIILLLAGASLYSADAEITYVKGKVEVQRGSEWIPLKPGDKVAQSEMISTGFQSEAKVKLIDSIMCLGPVTRITLEELSAGKSQDNVNVYLKTGSVRSQVNHTASKRVNYQVHTAIAVASARGTDYTVFDSNETLVTEGIVAVAAYTPVKESNSSSSVATEEDEVQEQESETVSDNTSDAASSDSNTESEPAPLASQGVLVKANQTLTVSTTSTITAPVNTVVQTVAAVVQVASTAASKESVQPASAGGDTGASVVENTVIPPASEKATTGKVNINIVIPQ